MLKRRGQNKEGTRREKQNLPGEIRDEVRVHTKKEIPQKSTWGGIPAVKDTLPAY